MPGFTNEYPCLTQYIRKLRGGSQPILARASDGLLYVVKFSNNLQGPNLLFNESMGNEMYRAFGLQGPSWKPLTVTDSFLDENRNCWMETSEGRLRPSSGVCFGSRFLGDGGVRLIEILPGTSFSRIRNRRHFWLAWLIDICAGHTDSRQALFLEVTKGDLEAFFIDHGHMFFGAEGQIHQPYRASCYLDARIYSNVDSNQILNPEDISLSLDADQIWQKVHELPEEWKRSSAISGFSECINRLSSLHYVSNTLEALLSSLPQVSEFDTESSISVRKSAVSVLRSGIQRKLQRSPLVA